MLTEKELVNNHVLHCQSSLIDHLLSRGMLFEDMVYSDNEDILEWWLVTPWLARQLQEQDETVIEQHNCRWWGRTCSGQAVYMDGVFDKICRQHA
ncbi:MAG: hypothetical protein LBM20_06160 [Rikenellaceae bacterium]|jgi:hypothetical protein|nr:hypothetical protein [Rikenellaceae bacterium]